MSVSLLDWLDQALQKKPSVHRFIHRNHALTYLAWGNPNKPPMIFLHGGLASAAWFSHIAPSFTDQYYVCALNFSGHGLSDWRDQYQLLDFIDELDSFTSQLNSQPISLVAHSLGARVAFWYCRTRLNRVNYLCLLDPPDITQSRVQLRQDLKKHRIQTFFRDAQSLIQRFKLIPKQPHYHAPIIRFVAEQSITLTHEGYRWQADINLFAKFTSVELPPGPETFTVPICDLIYGQHSEICTAEAVNTISCHYPQIQTILLPHAHHALMLDQPTALVELLQSRVDMHHQSTHPMP